MFSDSRSKDLHEMLLVPGTESRIFTYSLDPLFLVKSRWSDVIISAHLPQPSPALTGPRCQSWFGHTMSLLLRLEFCTYLFIHLNWKSGCARECLKDSRAWPSRALLPTQRGGSGCGGGARRDLDQRTRGAQSPEGLERLSQPVRFRRPVLRAARAAQTECEHGSACHLPAAAATGNLNLHGESQPREPHCAGHAHRTGDRPSSGGRLVFPVAVGFLFVCLLASKSSSEFSTATFTTLLRHFGT